MLVRAHNSHGMSEPSPVSDYVTTLVGEGDNSVDNGWSRPEIENNLNGTRVGLQQVDILSATALNITWKVSLTQYHSLKLSGPAYNLQHFSILLAGFLSKSIG